jgi:hypothetical protein
MSHRTPVLVAVGLVLLLLGWVAATAPFGAPDEASHYLRALNIAQGHLLGPKIRYPNVPGTPAQEAFVNHDTRGVVVPARLSPPDVLCVNGRPDASGSCQEATPTGDYYPPPYVLPALALKVSHDAGTALWLSRLLSALPCAVFVVLAIALLWDGTAWSLIGLLAAVTPMVLFVGSIINPSGLDTYAALATAAAAIRLARTPRAVPGWVWIALTISGAVTALSFQAGPVFLVAAVALGAGLLGRSGLDELRVGHRSGLVGSAVALLAALVLWLVYSRVSGASHSHFGVHPFLHSLRTGVEQLGAVLRDAIGNFGSLTVHLPLVACLIWWLFVLALLGAAVWLGDRRERIVSGIGALAVLAFPVLAFAWIYRYSGFGMQGRQVLPMLILIPLAAGEVLRRSVDRRVFRRSGLSAPGIGLVAFFQIYAWWYAAGHVAGNPSRVLFFNHARWSPPLGWGPWVAVACLGALALLASALLDAASSANGVRSARDRPTLDMEVGAPS